MTEEEAAARLRLIEIEQEQASLSSSPVEAEPDIIDRSIETIGQGLTAAKESLLRGDRSPAGNVQKALLGDVVGAAGDVAGDVVMTAGKEILPPSWQQGLSKAANYVTESAPVQAVGRGLNKWREASPETFARAGEIANLGALTVPKGPRVNFADDALMKKSNALIDQKRNDTMKLLEPDVVSARDIEVSPMMKNYERIAKDYETRMYDTVESVKDFNPRGNNALNVQALDSASSKIKKQLDADLGDAEKFNINEIVGPRKTRTDYPADDLTADGIEVVTDKGGLITRHIAELRNEPLLQGDAGTSARKIYEIFEQDIRKAADADGMISPLEVLAARRKLDNNLRKASKGIFDPTTTSANKVATRKIRQAINELVSEKAPDANVAESLSRQSDLLTAADNIDDIVARESRSGIGRGVQQIEDFSGLAPPRSPAAAAFNITSIPAIAVGSAATAGSLGARGLKNATRSISTTGKRGLQKAINSISDPAAKAAALAAINREEEIEVPYRR